MRRIVLIAMMLLAAMTAAGPALAQKIPMYIPQVAPMVIKPKIPMIKVIPPSAALRNALILAPQAKPLIVTLKGPHYIVKLKQGNQVLQYNVDAATGAVNP